jgi:leader peptidase (prepilin peptidase)/N-methyltransferase
MQVLFVIFSLIFGTAIGSFLNVLILRLPEGQSILGRSHCTKCGRVLGFWDLVPVLSFAFLGGKCAGCKTSISLRYPVIELLTGCLFAAGFLVLNPGGVKEILSLAEIWFLIALSITVFVIDFEHFLILDSVVFPAIIIALAFRVVFAFQSAAFVHYLLLALAGAAAGALPFYLIWLFSRGKFMGFGDVKLMLPLGLVLSWPNVWVAEFLAIIIGSIVGVGLLILGKKSLKSRLPFGCFLVIGAIAAKIWGSEILAWYLALLGL